MPLEEKYQIELIPWGLWRNMSSTKLNKYILTNFSIGMNKDTLTLAIGLTRLSGPFWFSLFIPSICLILAAEVALFIDEAHFEAMIMVSLTSNLVMYTLYSSIQQELPKDSSLKLVDIWMLHGLLMPMVVFITLAANELINTKVTPSVKGTKVANSAIKVYGNNSLNTFYNGNKAKVCMQVCKAIIPAVSILFIIAFFIICLRK